MRNVALTLWIVAVGLAQGQSAVIVSAQSVALASKSMVDAAALPAAPAGETAGTPAAAVPQTATRRPSAPSAAPGKASAWSDRGYVSLNGTYQATSNAFTGTATFVQNVEAGSVTTTYDSARPPVLDVGGAARVWRNLAVGAAVTWLSRDRNGSLSASVPHPFLFNTPRTMSGAVADVPRREVALHLNASWVVPAGRKTQIAIFGGPSIFRVTQGLVTDVTTSSAYPYDTATFVSATTVEQSQSQLGFNGGVDITARVAKFFGVGAIVRYSRASLQFPLSSGQETSIRAGGLQVGGGVRLAF
jgi:hypothetical protein